MTDRYVVIGNPVGHSLSPRIHAAFARQTSQDLAYDAVLAPLDGFARCVANLGVAGVRGANVTVPFKLEAFALATERTARAAAAGAANTLTFARDGLLADNTDGIGLIRDLANTAGAALGRARVLLLGAGGAARGVLLPLLDARPSAVSIANRTPDKARELAAEFNRRARDSGLPDAPEIVGSDYEGSASDAYDVIVNATSGGLQGVAPPLPARAVSDSTVAYDMVYGKGLTPFLAFCRQAGARRCHDGLGMLVEQAAEAFRVWRGVNPDASAVLAVLRSAYPAP